MYSNKPEIHLFNILNIARTARKVKELRKPIPIFLGILHKIFKAKLGWKIKIK
jgi:hypothetical protein